MLNGISKSSLRTLRLSGTTDFLEASAAYIDSACGACGFHGVESRVEADWEVSSSSETVTMEAKPRPQHAAVCLVYQDLKARVCGVSKAPRPKKQGQAANPKTEPFFRHKREL